MVEAGPGLAVVVVLLVAIAVLAVRATGLPLGRAVVTAAGRAVVQLAVVSAVLVVLLGSMPLTLLYVAFMAGVATVTCARRTGTDVRRPWVAVPIVAGAAPVVALVLASGVVPWEPSAVLPIAGILIGNAMTATTLAVKRMTDELQGRLGEYEAGLSLGLLPRTAVLEVARPSAELALVPDLDKTRTVGLVTLPGAFVGVLLGGGSAVEAGAAQLLVLIGILAAQAVCVLVTVQLVGARRALPDALRTRLVA
nr:ABC transporter permease [uncultured Actinotalea sp.]